MGFFWVLAVGLGLFLLEGVGCGDLLGFLGTVIMKFQGAGQIACDFLTR